MKTKQRQVFWRPGRRAFGLQVLTLMLLMLMGVSPRAWAETYNDPGGGTYNYSFSDWYGGIDFSKANYFKTRQRFSLVDKSYYWEFEFRCKTATSTDFDTFGEVDILTGDDKWHKIGEWQSWDSGSIDYFRVTDETWGYVRFVSSKDLKASGHNIVMQLIPKERCFEDGVKRFRVRFTDRVLVIEAHDRAPVAEIRFEKDMDTRLVDNLPLPALTVEWGDNMRLTYTARNVLDETSNTLCVSQYYATRRDYVTKASGYGIYSSPSLHVKNFETSNAHDGLKDIVGYSSLNPQNGPEGAYFYPVFIRYSGITEYDLLGDNKYRLKLTRPQEDIILDPFTRPVSFSVVFDKRKKRNVIRWEANKSAKGANISNKLVSRPCRFEGKWYVIRWDEGQSADTYKLVSELDGPTTDLSVIDEKIEYDKKYKYRVIFLPSVLSGIYTTDRLTSGILAQQGKLVANFWLEQEVDTKLEMPIKLAQDRTYEKAVRLIWEYCVQPDDQNWVIEYRAAGTEDWKELNTSLLIDPDKSEASFDADGTVCDMMEYRIRTTYVKRIFHSNIITGNLPAGSYISEVKASTGTEEKTVIVKWKVARADIVNDTYYHVLRRPVGTDEWTLLTDEVHGTASEYTYIDDRPLAGSYYEYSVRAFGSKCEEQVVQSDEVITPGFSQARGTITGHISYGTGTAAAGVRVNMVKSSADERSDQPQFLSRYIEGEGKGLQWTADSARYAGVLDGSKALTLQLWAKPQTAGAADTMALLRLAGALEVGVKYGGGQHHLYAIDNSQGGTAVREFPDLVFSQTDFTHVAAVYQTGNWTFYVGTDTLLTATMPSAGTRWNAVTATGSGTNAAMPTLSLGNSNRIGGAYSGYVDDIRLWNRALSAEEIGANYTRIQGGMESGLILYWPLDEGIAVKDYAFDVALQDGIYQLNHPEVGVNTQPSASVPRLLSLYGVTDAEGDYIIKGIPFQQGGTNYKLTPGLGIHEFSPSTRSMFVSPTSLTANNIDFEDVSSFPMEGHIYYAGTNIPAEGIQIYVDGDLQSEDGKIVQTDADGNYRVSVPIGLHYVEAKLDGHTMVGGGRFPTEGRFNFDRAMTYDFADSTLVNFVGRVAGGVRNDTLAVGFGASKNNIGQAVITLKLNNESFSFNTDASHRRIWASDTTAIRSTAQTSTNRDSTKYITIQTDPQTGEFSALLPPLKYTTKSIDIPKTRDNIEFSSLPQIDLTNVRKELTDSLNVLTEQGDSTWQYYKYNTKMVQTYFARPEMTLWQENGEGAFGEKELKNYAVSSTETTDITDIWTRQDDGTLKYTYNFPLFARTTEYKFGIFGYETYTNYDTGTAVRDTIPLNGQVVTVANEMSDKQDVVAIVTSPSLTNLKEGDIYKLKRTQLRLDDEGKNVITFKTGAPNVTAPYTRQFSTTFERNKRTYLGPQLNGIVLGELTNGDNFVTSGPDHVDMVLRDPPGSKGKVTWKTGTSYTTIRNETEGIYWDEALAAELIWGVDLTQAVGIGLSIVTTQNESNTLKVGEKGSYSVTLTNDTTFVYTTADNISSSTGSKYVGAKGDVFIGKSHNYIVGTCRKLGFHREASGIVFGLKEAVSVNDRIATDFIYSAREIEETMIPKLMDSLHGLLEYADSATAVNFENTTEKDVYLTWKSPTDKDYAQDGTYKWKRGTKPGTQDMVLFYNQSVKNWKQRLADNEQDKIEAMAKRDTYLKENRSFDGGTSYTYSERRDSTWALTSNTSTKTGATVETKIGIYLNAAATFGTNLILNTEVGYTSNSVRGDSLNNKNTYAEFEYQLEDGNAGTDFTVDILRSPRGWGDIFVLRGGQSYNPYEGKEYAKYYEPEKKHVISYGTEQVEQPVIRISTDGEVGATTATLNDIPAGGVGQFTLHLTNGTTTNQTIPFTYLIEVAEMYNQKGLQILMDGVPANGRGIYIPAGETVKKVITVRQTDESVLDYEDVTIWFTSQYQPFDIYDECKLNVHFKPSSSPVDLAVAEPVLNTGNKDGKLDMKLTNFNRKFKNLKNVGLQYRFKGSTQWTSLHTWVTDKADSTSTSFSLLPAEGDLRWTEDMSSDLSYPEGNYEFRAFTTTPYGTEQVQVYSDITTVTKDMTRPRNLYIPTPSNGILSYGDDISVEFNEDIVPSYVGDKNVIVTAKLNQRPVNHEVSLTLSENLGVLGVLGLYKTVNPIFLSGDFSMEFWLNRKGKGTILHQGPGTDNFALSIDDAGHVVVSIAGVKFTSSKTVPSDEWVYYALSYNADKMTFDMLAQYGTTNLELFKNEKVTLHEVQAINYADDNHLYLGPIDANMHDLSLYNICRDVNEAGAEKYQAKDSYVYGLTNYWPMNEGHGTMAADTRHTHDFTVDDDWQIENTNYALRKNDTDGATASIAQLNTSRGDSYAIELWYHPGVSSNEEVVFETGTPTIEGDKLPQSAKLKLYYDKDHNLILDYGDNSQTVAAGADLYGGHVWHHIALNVVRGQAASFYLNGQRTAVIAETNMPMLQGSHITFGRGSWLNFIDEVRIWKATLSESRLLSNMYNTIDTTDVYSRGLVAYYPFEKSGTVNGVSTKVGTLENMAPASAPTGSPAEMAVTDAKLVMDTPPIKNAPDETRLIASPVASERKVVINLTGSTVSARDIEGTTLNITLADIHDMHGNTSDPIKWTAYVQQNTLKWTRDSVNVIKKYGADYTFDVNIENKSGQTEYYTLYNMPQWLSLVDSERTDDVQPLKTKTLRFQVNPLVAVGNYDVTIGLQGNNEILEPLRIVMKVSGEKPQWAVDPTKYDHQMNIIGQVYINGILMENQESMVAAFIGGECRGVAQLQKVRGAAYVTMTVYGDDTTAKDAQKAVTFRIWDASKGVAYTDAQLAIDGSPIDVTFAQDKMLGNFDTPAIWTKTDKVEQLISVHENWNWIAFGVEPQSQNLDHIFSSYADWMLLIKDRKDFSDYNGAEWNGTLVPAVNAMYKLKVTRLPDSQPSTLNPQLSVSGRQPAAAEMPVTLKNGWNWIAYTPLTTMTIGEALAGANPQKGDIVKSQTGVAIYGYQDWEGSLQALEGGHGYMYYSYDSQEKSFVYPSGSSTQAAPPMRASRRAPGAVRIFTPVDPSLYPNNMTMAVQLKNGAETVDTCEVAAFVGDECRGATRANDNGLYYLVIAGEGAGLPMTLRTCLNGEIIDIDITQQFVSDGNIGTSWAPYVIGLDELTGISNITADDADDSDWWTLQGFKIGRKPTQPGVYIHHGQKVTVRLKKK